MQDEILSKEQSLTIIQQMINTAKREQKDDGMGWIIWGWLLFAASVLSYINIATRWFSQFFFWNAFGILTLVLLSWELIRNFWLKKQQRVKTYTGEVFKKLNIGFFITIMVLIVAMNTSLKPVTGFAILSGLYGFWVLIYGTLFDFRPSVIGAFVTWGCAFAGLFVKEFSHTMLLHAAGVLAGYIIPGHIAMNEFKKLNRKDS